MWIVELALRRAHTFIVMAIAIVLFGVIAIIRMPIDIFPVIDIPIVSCIWTYQGMSPYNMENLVTTVTERALTSTINGIQRMESMSLAGMSIIKVYLQKGTPLGESVAMVTSVGSAILRQLPRGINPPFVTESSATDVPVIQLGLRSNKLNEAQLFDIANNFVRNQLATVQGTITPLPYGGKYRQVMIDLNPRALIAYQLSPSNVVQAMQAQNVIHPSGTVKIGPYEYICVLNNMARTPEELNNIPVRSVDNQTVFLKDVAQVHDGYQTQTNIVNLNGRRAVLFNILKSGDASTLDVVQRVKAILPRLQALVPASCSISVLVDQSEFVRSCVAEVVQEAATAAGLTALMMLVLLGSWRSTLIVATSIPLAILAAIIGLDIAGQTINSMTLGGLALAVGMLVDDATVAVENLHVNLAMGKDIITAILDGAQQVALPALVSTLSICIVFVPVLFLTEPTRSLFVPMGMAVVFAMMASYGLSRTIVPLMSKYLLAGQHEKSQQSDQALPQETNNKNKLMRLFGSIHKFIDYHFESTRMHYKNALFGLLSYPKAGLCLFLGFYALSFCLLPFIGADYFPAIDSGQLRLHVCAPAGTRVEETEQLFKKVESQIKTIIPANEIALIVDNIGMPVSPINYAYSDSQTVSQADGEILISLSDKKTHSIFEYQKQIRQCVKAKFPQLVAYFQPADIITQILNAGLPAPIDIRVLGMRREENYKITLAIKREVDKVPGVVDVCLHQVVNSPHIFWEVNRVRAGQLGITQNDVSNSVLVSLSSSFQTSPNFWLNNKTGINYNLAVQTPPYLISSIDDMRNISITPSDIASVPDDVKGQSQQPQFQQPQLLTNLAQFTRQRTPSVVNHLNVQPVYDIYATSSGRDLWGVAQDIQKIIGKYKSKLQRGSFLFIGGQVMSMYQAFAAMIGGLFFAIVLVYLLLVVNFQSWTDPLIILMAIPGAFSGILWSLFVTQTTFSIPALMGTIMTVGVASANSILMVNFAKEQLSEGNDASQSALSAGFQRFRPVIMTATAMIIGMIPMAIGAGEGGSQNAPIGRAVIGGLLVATFSTLFFVPLMFSLTRMRQKRNI